MAFDTELQSLLSARRPHLFAIGEPFHGEPAFPRLRNRILETLAGYGFRSIAIESDRAAGLAEDFRTQLYADAPRLIRDTSTGSWNRARVLATTAIGLLTYHAAMAEPGTQSQRIGRLLAVRDALMAQNLLDILALERDRGPILVSANNAHLQRHPSRWATHWKGQDLAAQWNSAGSIVSPLLGDRYVYVAGSLGASGPVGLGPPEPGTYEERLGPQTGIFPPPADNDLHERTVDLLGYFPLDTGTIETCDAILHIGFEAGAVDAARITGLPGVTETRIQPGSEMPPYTWGDRFFFAGEDRTRPFATIVLHDVPDFDERSRLSEPGRYRLNIEVGRAEFRNLFGYGPEEFATHSDGLDFADTDRLMPHPAYAVQGWASVVNPGPATADEVTRLVAQARSRSADREHRRSQRP